MARPEAFYPPSPRDVPENLTAVSAEYRVHVFVVLISLFVFFFIYLGMVAGSGYLVYRAVAYAVQRNAQSDGALRIGLGVCGALLFLFLLKGFFKRGRKAKPLEIEITEEEHPKLFDFIGMLCDETGAPFPHRVFVSPEVNAAVFYNSSLFSLFWPTPKNLLIGLGLVNVLNLTEFKSVLAHEFGHFAQSSMKLGGYVYVTQHIIADLVYSRGALDDHLDHLCRVDIRLAIFGWVFKAILWTLRKFLAGLYHIIIFLHSALSREMEFHADLVAVSVTGSDATAHVLAKLRFAEEALNQACHELQTAADHHIYTSDMFFHQNHAAAYLRHLRKDPHLGEPPPLPADPREVRYLFELSDEGTPSMWATHPSNYDREVNAKEEYIRTDFDERSPWLLFDDVKELRERVTWRFYRAVLKVSREEEVSVAEEVQTFIDDEHAETTYDERYHGLYDGRAIEPGDVRELVTLVTSQPWEAGRLARVHPKLYNPELKEWVREHNRRVEEYNLLFSLTRGQGKQNDLQFRGETYRPREAKRLLKIVDRELEKDQEWLSKLDQKVFLVHYQMAVQSDQQAAARDLVDRYLFHVGVQKILKKLMAEQRTVMSTLQFLSGKRQLRNADFQEALSLFRQAHKVLADSLSDTRTLLVPELKNMKAGEPLRGFLLEKRLVHELEPDEQSLQGTWIDKFQQQLAEVLDKIRRIHFKSLGGILSFQQRIGEQCLAQWAALPQVTPVKPKS